MTMTMTTTTIFVAADRIRRDHPVLSHVQAGRGSGQGRAPTEQDREDADVVETVKS